MQSWQLRMGWVGAVLCGAAASAFARPEHNAFLEVRAANQQSLVRQLRNRRVMNRYARHFGMTYAQLSKLFNGLHSERMTRATPWWVYNVDARGVIRARLLHLRAGTWVWADAHHRPVLKQSCGNPMRLGSDARRPRAEPEMDDRPEHARLLNVPPSAPEPLAMATTVPQEAELLAEVPSTSTAVVTDPVGTGPVTAGDPAGDPGTFSLLPSLPFGLFEAAGGFLPVGGILSFGGETSAGKGAGDHGGTSPVPEPAP